jgi:hypothetical protein
MPSYEFAANSAAKNENFKPLWLRHAFSPYGPFILERCVCSRQKAEASKATTAKCPRPPEALRPFPCHAFATAPAYACQILTALARAQCRLRSLFGEHEVSEICRLIRGAFRPKDE